VLYKHRYVGMPQIGEKELGFRGEIESKRHLSFLRNITNKDEFNKVMYYGGNDDFHLKMQVTEWPIRFINVLSTTVECTKECGSHGDCIPDGSGGSCGCHQGYTGETCDQRCLSAGVQPSPMVMITEGNRNCASWSYCATAAAGSTPAIIRFISQSDVEPYACLDLTPYGKDGAYCCGYLNMYKLMKCGITPCSLANTEPNDQVIRAELIRRSEYSNVVTYSPTCYSHYLPYFGRHNTSDSGHCGPWLDCLHQVGVADVVHDMLDKTGIGAGSNYCRKIGNEASCCVQGQIRSCNLPVCLDNLEIDNIDYINETTFENLTYGTTDVVGHDYVQTDVMVHGHFIVGANAIIPGNTVNTVFYMNNTKPGNYYTRIRNNYVYLVQNDSSYFTMDRVLGHVSLYVKSVMLGRLNNTYMTYLDHSTHRFENTAFTGEPRWITMYEVSGLIFISPAGFDATVGKHVRYYLQSNDKHVAECILEEGHMYEALMRCTPLRAPVIGDSVYFALRNCAVGLRSANH